MVICKQYSPGFVVPILVFVLLLTGCSQDAVSQVDAMDRPAVSYLTESVPPCTPIEGSSKDPCAVDRPARVESTTSASGWPRWVSSGVFPSYTEVLLGFGFPAIAPHLVIRGVVLADSTRCDLYSLEDYGFEGDRIQWKNAYHYYCFSEVAVRDYIVGEGPSTLTVIMHGELLGLSSEEAANWDKISDTILANLESPEARTSARYEGKELVLFLAPAPTVSVEAWEALASSTSFWFVQRRGDTTRAVSPDLHWADTAEERAALDMPLDDLVVKIKAAAVERKTLTGGRVGITAVDGAVAADGEGERFPPAQGVRAGATLPMLVTDGNKLQDYYVAAGAVYEGEGKTVLPPSPPADFVPPSTTTAPSTTTTVSASTTSSTVETTTSITVAPSSTTTTSDPSTTSTTSAPTSTTTTPEPTTTVPVTSTTAVSTTTSTTVAPTTTTVPTTSTSTVTSTTTTTVGGGVSISVSDASATEGEWMVFNVTLSEEPYRQVAVNYDVRDITAESGVDYQSPTGTFLFGPFDVQKTVRVWIVDDYRKEEAETFELVLSDPYGAPITKSVGTGTILDNDS